MEDKDKNVEPKPGKSIWRKSNFKKEAVEKCKKKIRFNLNEDVQSHESILSTPKKNGSSAIGEPSPKKRKKDLDMPNIPNEVEREIEMQYHSKAKGSKLTTRNVKTILKSVITNQFVVDMVRAAEEGGPSHSPFELKLTRAKTKELLQQHPDIAVPPVVGLLTPVKPSTDELSPEVKLLIDKELSEDSSDEEYNPENEPEPSEDEEKGDASMASDLDSLPPTPASSQAPPTPVHETSYDWSQDGVFKIPQENVGQRTRSKLDFHNLPLECIEQAYVPPDITADMYETECDNPDWQDFLKEFTQPLAPNETLDDDPENDPEYNILEDEDKNPVDYKEEMRKDKAVKVSKKELNALMKELFETETLSSDDDEARTSESIAELEASIMKETEDRERREQEERKKKQIGFHPNQRLLLAQQLRQHVQQTTQHFLQTYRHPAYHRHADTCRTMLTTLSGLQKDNVCCRETYNLGPAMQIVAEWERIHNQPQTGDKIRMFVADQIKAEAVQKKNRKKMIQQFPVELISLMMESKVFLYPMLLPPTAFLTSSKAVGPNYFAPSEDMLLAICLEQVTQLMEDSKNVYKKRTLADKCRIIHQACIPRSSPRLIAAHIRKLKGSKVMNPVKAFFENGKPPIVCHYVVPVLPSKKLCQQPPQLLPEVWRNFLTLTYKKQDDSSKSKSDKVISVKGKPRTNSEVQEKQKIVFSGSVKEPQKPQRKDVSTKEVKRVDVTKKEVKSVEIQLRSKTNKALETKEVLSHKETSKPKKEVVINNILKSARIINQEVFNLCEKPKTTKKDIRNMLAKANSIQNAVGITGLPPFEIDLLKKIDDKPVKSTKRKTSKITNKSKSNKKEINCRKHKVKSTSPQPNPSTPGKSKTKKTTSKKLKKAKKQLSEKKRSKTGDLKSLNTGFSSSMVPKIKFNVVSKTPLYNVKLENKGKEKSLVKNKDTYDTQSEQQGQDIRNNQQFQDTRNDQQFQDTRNDQQFQDTRNDQQFQDTRNDQQFQDTRNDQQFQDSRNGQQYHNGPEVLPQVLAFRENDDLTNCASHTLNTEMAQSNGYRYLGSQVQSESDSHQSNSIESEQTPLVVNIVKSSLNSKLYSPRPPSTVKLKGMLNPNSHLSLRSGKVNVPAVSSLSVYSKLNGTS